MERLHIIAAVAVYVIAARAAAGVASARWRAALFAIVNVVGTFWIFEWPIGGSPAKAVMRMALYGGFVAAQFLLTRTLARARGLLPWIAFWFPIVVLILLKYAGPFWTPWADRHLGREPSWTRLQLAVIFVGLSFMAFRLSKLVIDVRSGAVEMLTAWDFFGFAFFVPTMVVGPINPASVHMQSLSSSPTRYLPVGTCLIRILIGAGKNLFLAGALSHLGYADLYLDGHPHHLGDFAVSAVAYYLYLYCNFSGFCDMAIGVAGLARISVVENFRSPLSSRNIKDFWSRWHISLSNYVREVLFNPLSSMLAKRVAPSRTKHAIAVALIVTFLATGVWHGAGWRYAIFGLLHGVAIVAHHYYLLLLRRRLTREQLKGYNESGIIRALAVVTTFAFVSLTFTVFANDIPDLKKIAHVTPHLPESPLYR